MFSYDSIIFPDLTICQPLEGFRFGIDSVVLAWFASVKTKDQVVDIGAGSGVISALLCRFRSPASVTAVEMQDEMYTCLEKTAELNPYGIKTVQADIREYKPQKPFTFAVCNPPYRTEGTGYQSANSVKRTACFDNSMTIDDILSFCKSRLKFGSRLALTGDADRLAYFIEKCTTASFEPKRLMFLHPAPDKKAKLFFLESAYGGGSELLVEPPVYQEGNIFNKNYLKLLQGDWN